MLKAIDKSVESFRRWWGRFWGFGNWTFRRGMGDNGTALPYSGTYFSCCVMSRWAVLNSRLWMESVAAVNMWAVIGAHADVTSEPASSHAALGWMEAISWVQLLRHPKPDVPSKQSWVAISVDSILIPVTIGLEISFPSQVGVGVLCP